MAAKEDPLPVSGGGAGEGGGEGDACAGPLGIKGSCIAVADVQSIASVHLDERTVFDGQERSGAALYIDVTGDLVLRIRCPGLVAADGPAVLDHTLLIGQPVAVIVGAVRTELLGAGVGRGGGVVAVGVVGDMACGRLAGVGGGIGVAEAVAVVVGVEGACVRGVALVGLSVAVVVDAIAQLGGAGVDGAVGVVAVGVVGDIACGQRAGIGRGRGVTEAVAVVVGVEGARVCGVVLVGLSVAVVVDVVAQLGGAGVDCAVGVVAVGTVGHPCPLWLGAGIGGGGGIAKAIAVGVAIPGARHPFVDETIAIVVGAIAQLWSAGVDVCVGVVAVVAGGHIAAEGIAALGGGGVIAEAVDILVGIVGAGHPLVDETIAVVVDAITQLWGAGVDGEVAIVTVLIAEVAVAVLVERPAVLGARVLAVFVGRTGHAEQQHPQSHLSSRAEPPEDTSLGGAGMCKRSRRWIGCVVDVAQSAERFSLRIIGARLLTGHCRLLTGHCRQLTRHRQPQRQPSGSHGIYCGLEVCRGRQGEGSGLAWIRHAIVELVGDACCGGPADEGLRDRAGGEQLAVGTEGLAGQRRLFLAVAALAGEQGSGGERWGEHRAPLGRGQGRQPQGLQDGGRHVPQADQGIDGLTSPLALGQLDDQGDVELLLGGVCAVIKPQLPLGEALAVVCDKDDQRAIVAIGFLERGDDPSHLGVREFHSLGIPGGVEAGIGDLPDALVLGDVELLLGILSPLPCSGHPLPAPQRTVGIEGVVPQQHPAPLIRQPRQRGIGGLVSVTVQRGGVVGVKALVET